MAAGGYCQFGSCSHGGQPNARFAEDCLGGGNCPPGAPCAHFLCCLPEAGKGAGGASAPAALPIETFKGKDIVEAMSAAQVRPAYTDLTFATLYHADIDNDGHMDWVLCERNSVGLHNDQILGVYLAAPSSGAMIDAKASPPSEGPFADKSILYFGDPFLREGAEGVTMNLVDSTGQKPARYLWKGKHVRRL